MQKKSESIVCLSCCRAARSLNFQNEIVAMCFLAAAGDLIGLKGSVVPQLHAGIDAEI